MNKSNKFSAEVRERAVRMVQEHRGEYPVTVGGDRIHRPEDRLYEPDAAELGQARELIAVSAKASPRRNASASRHWSVRLRNCAVPMRS